MRRRQATAASVLVLVALVAAGCDGADSVQPESTGEVTRTDVAEDRAQDAAACAAVSDVLAIVENADAALSEGRMAAQEQQGWYGLATRALGRIPSSGDGAVSQGVAELKEAAPPVGAGTAAEPVGVRSDAWNHAVAGLNEACLAADADIAISMFTGG